MEKTLIYEVYPISFMGRFGGKSALRRIKDFIPEINNLGVKYIWLCPIYFSPWFDHGYDVADYTAIDPRLGLMDEFEELVKTAKEKYGIGILMDLVLNHTSTYHRWFHNYPEFYYWSKTDREDWQNLFNKSQSAWKYEPRKGEYYMHLFHETQADLNWFPDGSEGEPNPELIKKFQDIVDFWVEKGVAGFRLDVPQAINKDIFANYYEISLSARQDLIQMAKKVINGVFDEIRKDLYLLMECFDIDGTLCRYYYDNTPVNAIMDIVVKNAASNGAKSFIAAAEKAFQNCPEGYAHVTESHDGPRFTTVADVRPNEAIDILFGYYDNKKFISPQTIVIYQGQELGLENPDSKILPDKKLLSLDAATKMRHEAGESLKLLRPESRANARVKLPMKEYLRQKKSLNSCLRRQTQVRAYKFTHYDY